MVSDPPVCRVECVSRPSFILTSVGASGALALLGRLGRSLLRRAPGTAAGEGRAAGRSPPWVEGTALMARGADSKWAQKTRFPWWWGGGAEQRWPQKGGGTGGTDGGARVGGWRFPGGGGAPRNRGRPEGLLGRAHGEGLASGSSHVGVASGREGWRAWGPRPGLGGGSRGR